MSGDTLLYLQPHLRPPPQLQLPSLLILHCIFLLTVILTCSVTEYTFLRISDSTLLALRLHLLLTIWTCATLSPFHYFIIPLILLFSRSTYLFYYLFPLTPYWVLKLAHLVGGPYPFLLGPPARWVLLLNIVNIFDLGPPARIRLSPTCSCPYTSECLSAGSW